MAFWLIYLNWIRENLFLPHEALCIRSCVLQCLHWKWWVSQNRELWSLAIFSQIFNCFCTPAFLHICIIHENKPFDTLKIIFQFLIYWISLIWMKNILYVCLLFSTFHIFLENYDDVINVFLIFFPSFLFISSTSHILNFLYCQDVEIVPKHILKLQIWFVYVVWALTSCSAQPSIPCARIEFSCPKWTTWPNSGLSVSKFVCGDSLGSLFQCLTTLL